MKKPKYSYIATALILSVVTLCVTGCLAASSTATLPNGVSFTSKGTSVMSKTGLKGLGSSFTLSPTNATRTLSADVSTEAQINDVRMLVRDIASGVAAGMTGNPGGLAATPPAATPAPPPALQPWELLGITEESWAQLQSIAEAANRNGDAPATSSRPSVDG